jgi:hypothetical protein
MRWAVLDFGTGGVSKMVVVICTSKRCWVGSRVGLKVLLDVLFDTESVHFVLQETGGSTNQVGYLSSYVLYYRG